MPRIARLVIPGLPHHVTQRGNHREDVFFDDADRRAYLSFFKEHAERFGFSLLGYCLMTNHVHLIGVPAAEDSIAKAVGGANWRHAQRLNRRMKRNGHLWQSRFYSCPLDQPHLLTAMAYVELNPVRAGLAASAFDYEWSSAFAHAGGGDRSGMLDLAAWSGFAPGIDWREFVRAEAAADPTAIRLHTHRGLPLGDEAFIQRLESALDRRLRPLPQGRPRKEDDVQ